MAVVSGDPMTVYRELLEDLARTTTAGATGLRAVVDTNFAADAELRAPLFAVASKDAIYHFWHAWQTCFRDDVKLLEAATTSEGKVLLKIKHQLLLRPLNLVHHSPFASRQLINLLQVPFIVTAVVETRETPRGRLITRWTEDVSLYTVIYNFLWFNKVLDLWRYAEAAGGAAIVNTDRVLSSVWSMFEPVVGPAASSLLRSVDRVAKESLGYDLRLSNASARLWSS